MAVTGTLTPFAAEDFARRMDRAVQQAEAAGLTGILVAPGPDLLYFTGYQPIAITERITMLVLQGSRGPSMIVPVLERPDAEAAPGAAAVALTDWTDGSDPYAAAAKLLDPRGRYAISDSAWAMHVLALQQALPESTYVSMTSTLPMLR
ncbi:MAG: aminopeptidase P family N-terminal domain-containing protein, partial [Gaiellaceae bacterium]